MDPRPRRGEVRALVLVCAACIGVGAYLRVQNLAFAGVLTFDEHHFVLNARNYLAGASDWNDHPPLGKLLIAGSIRLFGDTPYAWRGVSLAFGLAAIALALVLGRVLFADACAGALCATCVAVDGLLLVYSRTALLDGLLVGFAFAVVLLVARQASVGTVLAAGAVIGLASSIKLSGVTLVLPLALAVAWEWPWRRVPWLLLASASVALGVYYVQYAGGLMLSHRSATPAAVARATVAMVEHHAALVQWQNPLTSHWYSWPLPTRPIWMSIQRTSTGMVRTMIGLDNPLLWWASWAVVVGMLVRLAWVGMRGVGLLCERIRPWRSEVLLCAGWLGFLLPWVISTRDSYLYHYLPSHAFALLLLGGAAARAFRRLPGATLVAVSLVVAGSAFYAPIWAALPVTDAALAHRIWLPAWR